MKRTKTTPLKIESRRKKLGISQYRLAKLSGLSQGALSHFEAGNREPRLSSLRKIAAALECQVQDLF